MIRSLTGLAWRSTRFHAAGAWPVILGVAVGAAALTGALLIGDSLRGSLRERALRQLNGVESALLSPRYVRQQLAADWPGVTPALVLTASARSGETALGRVTIYGLDPAGFARFGVPEPGTGVVLGARTAKALGVRAGDRVELGVERFSLVPRSSLLGRRGADDVAASWATTVLAVLPDDAPAGEFNLSPGPDAPLVVFAPLAALQNQVGRPWGVSALLSDGGDQAGLAATLAARLTLSDYGLSAGVAPARNAYVAVSSESLVLPPSAVGASVRAAESLGLRAAPTISYLANAITADALPLDNADAGAGRKLIPYSVIAALDPTLEAPLGPFSPDGRALADDEIVLVDWQESPLRGLAVSSPVTLHFFRPELEQGTEQSSATFRLTGYVPLSGAALDPDLTPAFPGITDQLSITTWNSPFPITSGRVKPRDEDYWKRHKATPKAYINYAAGERLFSSRYGVITGVRIAGRPGQPAAEFAPGYAAKLLAELDPASAGLTFRPVREQQLEASKGGTDFAALFLAFSGLLVLAALLLVGLLFRLAIDRRAAEVGVLAASGYSPGRVLGYLAREGALLALAGTATGLVLAVAYAWGMIHFLTSLWPDPELGTYLRLHARPESFVLGALLTLAAAAAAVLAGAAGLRRVPPPMLLRGATSVEAPGGPAGRGVRPWVGGLILALGVVPLGLGRFSPNPDARAGAFFGGGLLLLAGGFALAWATILRPGRAGAATAGVPGLAWRGVVRNRRRAALTAVLVALAAFLVVSVESFRKRPDSEFAAKSGGSGGYALVAEASVPLYQGFGSGVGRDDLTERLTRQFQKRERDDPAGPTRAARLAAAEADLEGMRIVALPMQPGEDASCANLYQARQPRAIGATDEFVARGGFRFGDSLADSPGERANPFELLRRPTPSGGAVPVILEMNTAMFMLKVGLGGEFELRDGAGRPFRAKVVGLLQDSIFAGEVLLPQGAFRQHFPSEGGYRVFLVECPPEKADAVAKWLRAAFAENGLVVATASGRAGRALAVVGAYLSTFQLLGVLALALAVLGVGAVILRGVWERRGEFGLLRAVGYSAGDLRRLMLFETLGVLALGVGVGSVAALASVLPNVALGGRFPTAAALGLAAAVAVTGPLVSALAVSAAARVPVVRALRQSD